MTCAVEQAADGIAITDTSANIQYVNPGFTRLTGYSAEEAVGKNASLLRSGRQTPGYYEALWKTINTGEPWHGQLINRRKDGTLYPEEMTITPVRNSSGAVINFIAIKQDVTERQTTEDLRAFLASLVESSADAIIGCTWDGRILSWNPAAEALYGYPTEKAIGEPFLMLAGPDRVNELGLLLDRVKRGESVVNLDTVLLRPDGTSINVSVRFSQKSPGRRG